METKKVLLVMTILMLFAGTTTPWISSAQDDRPTLRKITQEKSQDLKEGQFLLEMTPCYYKYKTDSEDWMNMGLFFKANVAPSLEIGIGSDFLSYQNPDFGLSDIYAGAKWKFYAKNDWTLAFS